MCDGCYDCAETSWEDSSNHTVTEVTDKPNSAIGSNIFLLGVLVSKPTTSLFKLSHSLANTEAVFPNESPLTSFPVCPKLNEIKFHQKML